MANLDELTKRSLRAYELGRFRMAAAIALVILPLGALCLIEPAFREQSACCIALLLAASIWLRHRNQRGVEAVTTGLVAGALPFALSLTLGYLVPGCGDSGVLSYCSAISVVGGAAAGLIAARRLAKSPAGASWLGALAIASLAAALGCLRLGAAGVLGAALGLAVGQASAMLRLRSS